MEKQSDSNIEDEKSIDSDYEEFINEGSKSTESLSKEDRAREKKKMVMWKG